MPPLPSQREELFAQHCAFGKSNSDAYVAAGYKPNSGNASDLKAKERVSQRIFEIQQSFVQKAQITLVKSLPMTRQYLLDALQENIEKALARAPVRVGSGDGETAATGYIYRGEVANNAIKMAGSEVGLFRDRTEITHRMDFSDLSDEQLLVRLRDEADALLLEQRAAGLEEPADGPAEAAGEPEA